MGTKPNQLGAPMIRNTVAGRGAASIALSLLLGATGCGTSREGARPASEVSSATVVAPDEGTGNRFYDPAASADLT